MSYHDMTFCPYWQKCSRGSTCHRAWTPDKEADAKGFLISFFADKPECFTPLDTES